MVLDSKEQKVEKWENHKIYIFKNSEYAIFIMNSFLKLSAKDLKERRYVYNKELSGIIL